MVWWFENKGRLVETKAFKLLASQKVKYFPQKWPFTLILKKNLENSLSKRENICFSALLHSFRSETRALSKDYKETLHICGHTICVLMQRNQILQIFWQLKVWMHFELRQKKRVKQPELISSQLVLERKNNQSPVNWSQSNQSEDCTATSHSTSTYSTNNSNCP